MAQELLEKWGMDKNQTGQGLNELLAIKEFLPEYQIRLWVSTGGVPVEYANYNTSGHLFIGLFYNDGYYDPIIHQLEPIPKRFCYACTKFADDNHYTECKEKCRKCEKKGEESVFLTCDICNVIFRTVKCFNQHKIPVQAKAYSHCEKYERCRLCSRTEKSSKYRGPNEPPHNCEKSEYCRVCREKTSPDHECSHPVPSEKTKTAKKEKQAEWVIVVYDTECVVVNNGNYEQRDEERCDNCKEQWDYSCTDEIDESTFVKPAELTVPLQFRTESEEMAPWNITEGPPQLVVEETRIFEEERPETHNPMARFAQLLVTDVRFKKCYIFAHNAGKYDHVFLMGELIKYGKESADPSMILNGFTMISADLKYVSSNVVGEDAGSFRIGRRGKGIFPYFFNHPDNYKKKLDHLPPQHCYGFRTMNEKMQKEFNVWYEANRNNPFNLEEALRTYCRSDVRILTLTLIKFIKICEEMFAGWNPVLNSRMLASFTRFVLVHEYNKKGDVGYIPERGYACDTNSRMAFKALQWEEKKDPNNQRRIHYALRGREKRHTSTRTGKTYKFDGFIEETNEVFEIHGCIYHGCPKCHPIRDVPSRVVKGETMGSLYDRTMARDDDIREEGFILHVKWECEIREELKKNAEMRRFFRSCNYTHRLRPRDALFGGRTQAFRTLSRENKKWLLQYWDFVSMYPYLNAGGVTYPRGNPVVMTVNMPPVDEKLKVRGLVYCDVLPPTNLAIGVLPSRINGKLMFPLCRSCAEQLNMRDGCVHVKYSERYLTGVWTTDELEVARDDGYRVLKYHEIWYWNKWMTGGFFADYIKPLLKRKHESSGWPHQNMSAEEKKEYIEKIEVNDKVRLEEEKIAVNPALRQLSKIFLNSAWGKFAENPIRAETLLVWKKDDWSFAN